MDEPTFKLFVILGATFVALVVMMIFFCVMGCRLPRWRRRRRNTYAQLDEIRIVS